MPGFPDHALALLLAVGMPIYAARTYRHLLREVREGGTAARITQYRHTIALQWTLLAGTLLLWELQGRALADLGLALPLDGRSVLGAAVVAAGLAVLLVQWRGIRRLTPAREASLRAQMAPVADLLPRTERDGAVFRRLAVTAGICEEVLYRGFLIWYVAWAAGPWGAVAITALVFGCAHLYQGAAGALKTGAVGAVTGVLYVVTGSLLWPAVLHAAVDLQGGAAARRILGPPTELS